MFTEGNILYSTPFYFKNGNPAKSKYFVVLKTNGDNSVLASLPTRRNSIPPREIVENGCIELPDIDLNCFVLSNMIEATTCKKKFEFPTYIYGHELDIYDITLMNDIYRLEGTDYILWGKLKMKFLRS